MKAKLMIMMMLLCCILSMQAGNVALLVGIGNYNREETGWSVIHGNNDVSLLRAKLVANDYRVETLVDAQATKKNVMKAIGRLIASTTAGDVVYVHFSGHGQLVWDANYDENALYDQSFVCYDACYSPKYSVYGRPYRGQNHLIDDELFPMLDQLKKKVGSQGEVVVTFDSCYSGGADRGEVTDEPDPAVEVEWVNTTRGTSDEFEINRNVENYLRQIKAPGVYTTMGGRITVISACESDKRNYECRDRYTGECYGSLSFCIGKLLDKHIPVTQWYEYFKEQKYIVLRIFRPSQHPVVECH